MITYLDLIFFFFTSVISTAVFSMFLFIIIDFITAIGAKKKPAYYRMENDNIYAVYKWSSSRCGGHYITFKFKKRGNKWILLRRKFSFPNLLPAIIISGVFFIISVIKAGILTGIAVLFYFVFIFLAFNFALQTYNVLYCKRFLNKKLKK